jgi:hypothetical protein
MIRTSIAAALVYAVGLPFFDGYRPAVLDEPLQTFAAQINLAAQYSWRMAASIDVPRLKQHVSAYVERTRTELRRASNRSSR